MTLQYEIPNQLTGVSEKANTFEEALALQSRLRNEYFAMLESLFTITVLVQNEDGSWTQSVADESGNPIIYTDESIE
jgi:hypothetical protein